MSALARAQAEDKKRKDVEAREKSAKKASEEAQVGRIHLPHRRYTQYEKYPDPRARPG